MEPVQSARRSMLSGVGAAIAAIAFGSKRAAAQAPAESFRPARHQQDEWMSQVPGKHRTIIDCATVSGAGEGMLYANNLYVGNRNGYQLNESDVAVVVCLRHVATAFAYNDAIWGKYGQALSSFLQFVDPKTKQPPSTNLLNSPDYGMALPNFGNSIASLVKRGTHFAVCEMATRRISGQLAGAAKAEPQAVFKELSANLIPNGHLVAAGVVAINRAQEFGYTLLTAL
jgi:intracellular sulfur oxidation DsrE/DsrF family protein